MFITQPSTVIPATNIHTHYLNKMDRMPNVMHLAHNCYRVMVRIVLELYPPYDTYISWCRTRAINISHKGLHPTQSLPVQFTKAKRSSGLMAKTETTREEILPSGHQTPQKHRHACQFESSGLHYCGCSSCCAIALAGLSPGPRVYYISTIYINYFFLLVNQPS